MFQFFFRAKKFGGELPLNAPLPVATDLFGDLSDFSVQRPPWPCWKRLDIDCTHKINITFFKQKIWTKNKLTDTDT